MSKNQLVPQGFLFLHGKKLYKYAMSLTVLVASIPFLREKGNFFLIKKVVTFIYNSFNCAYL